MMTLLLLFSSIFLFLAYKFATAYGDFTLMSKKEPKREEIEDKVVWITGASRGIGEILAKQLARLGAKIIISARNEAELERVKQQLKGKHAPREVKILPLDLTTGEDSLKKAVEKAESFFPGSGVDYMIHNAAFERPKSSALDVTEESLKATFDVNVFGTITLTRLLAPFMLSRGQGHFVVISSAAGKTPAPGQAVYSASKHALNGYFHSLRSELCQKGIKVTVVCPGPIETSNDSGAKPLEKGLSERQVEVKAADLDDERSLTAILVFKYPPSGTSSVAPSVYLMSNLCSFMTCDFKTAKLVGSGEGFGVQLKRRQPYYYFPSVVANGYDCLAGLTKFMN